ncbi:gram-negative bacterial tonB protein [Roseovarius sp. A-2]|uniref:energy transducer TonB family protein n=1 Tax=Roseovarius sp. A-2 TaxID=1570360 RepID=UPI0009B569E0|nr:energy transducer TonB [Roseovarius sp. A-2]GAW34303.1 gram-negative bacterial tonB protein [Roseovarius sp. A-2]
MTRGRIYAAIAAVVLSLLLHALGLRVTSSDDQPPVSEDRTADVTDVGRAFEDFAETTVETADPEPASPPETPSVTSPEQVTEETPMTQALVASDNPQDVTAPDTGTVDVVAPDAVEPSVSEAAAPETSEPPGGEDDRIENLPVLTPLEPDMVAETPDGTGDEHPEQIEPETVEAATVPPAETVAPVPSPSAATGPAPEVQQPVLPEITVAPAPDDPETLTAQDSEEATSSAVTTSLRPPKERPSVPTARARAGTPAGRSSGTIESPLTAYKRTGIDPFASGSSGTQTGTSGFSGSRNPGNASTTNYVGRVLMQLNRSPVVYPAAHGTAQVSFAINPDGSVAWVSILSSSGSGDIGRAASAQVRSAAPFPPPPQGTSQRLVFLYRNR